MPANKVGGKGSYNVVCDECGLKYKAGELMRRYDGAMVCKYDWEPRHPQEFVRAKKDNPVLPFVRPDNDGTDVGPDVYCDALTFGYQTVAALNAELALGNVTIYKTRAYGGGSVDVPSGSILTVVCELDVE